MITKATDETTVKISTRGREVERRNHFSREIPHLLPTNPRNKSPIKMPKKKSKSSRSCDCNPEKKSRTVRRRKIPPSVNPFIIFYLTEYFKNPSKRVTEVAREAGKKWCGMSESEKSCYIKRAKQESAKRQRRGRKRSRGGC
uniref:HMGB5 protein n=1 Tax=Fopius arisanus TaxID=64838 RepID=A0A0C9R644_9HYME